VANHLDAGPFSSTGISKKVSVWIAQLLTKMDEFVAGLKSQGSQQFP